MTVLTGEDLANLTGTTPSPQTGNIVIEADTFIGDLQGNATTADKLAKEFTLVVEGDVHGSVTTDGSKNKVLNATVSHADHSDVSDYTEQSKISERASLADLANLATYAIESAKSRLADLAIESEHATDSDHSINADKALQADKASESDHAVRADNATHSDSADKDGQGNVITDTYARDNDVLHLVDYARQVNVTGLAKGEGRVNRTSIDIVISELARDELQLFVFSPLPAEDADTTKIYVSQEEKQFYLYDTATLTWVNLFDTYNVAIADLENKLNDGLESAQSSIQTLSDKVDTDIQGLSDDVDSRLSALSGELSGNIATVNDKVDSLTETVTDTYATKEYSDGNLDSAKLYTDSKLVDYLPLVGGNVTGNLTVKNKNVVRTINDVEADANGNIDIIVPDATTEVKGIVQLCDDIEQNTDNRTMAVTPHAVAAYVSTGGKKANDIGIVGRQGFGVSFPDATEDELAAIGMSPMNGTYDKTSDNYGNFMSDNGGVFVYIPHHYIRYGDQTDPDYYVYGANVLSVKSHDAYNSEAEANADGYFSPRAFYDGSESVNQQGFFMQKFEPLAKTLDGVVYPYGDGTARGMVSIDAPTMMTRARNLGSDYFVASYFMHQAMDTITLLQGQHSTGTANCAWWKSKGGANYPNNGCSTTNPQLYSHNGQKCGVIGVSNFTWEFCLGVTTPGTSASQGQTVVANNKIYLLKPTVKIKDLTNGFDGSTDAWGTTANLLENYDEFDTTDHFVLTSSRIWYWGNGNNQMYISPVKNGVLDTKARDTFMLIPNTEQSVSSSANTMMGACLSYANPCTQNLALYLHGENVSSGGSQNVFSRLFISWRTNSNTSCSFRCGAYLRG